MRSRRREPSPSIGPQTRYSSRGGGSDLLLIGRRLTLRPLSPADFSAWREVRIRNEEWLIKWEPKRIPGQADPIESRDAFSMRCNARKRERQLGTGYGFGIFVDGRTFCGEINLNSVQRGPFQSSYVGYWIDEAQAGNSYMSEALVMVTQCAFEKLGLHRIQVAIIPRNSNSRRVVEKLGLREEGVARRYLEINGVWEDHMRFGFTAEDWNERGEQLIRDWL